MQTIVSGIRSFVESQSFREVVNFVAEKNKDGFAFSCEFVNNIEGSTSKIKHNAFLNEQFKNLAVNATLKLNRNQLVLLSTIFSLYEPYQRIQTLKPGKINIQKIPALVERTRRNAPLESAIETYKLVYRAQGSYAGRWHSVAHILSSNMKIQSTSKLLNFEADELEVNKVSKFKTYYSTFNKPHNLTKSSYSSIESSRPDKDTRPAKKLKAPSKSAQTL
ncbi:hypothetical protein ACU8KH_03607 [Lachancea thermotolerans]